MTDFSHSTPLATSDKYSRSMIPLRIEGLLPSDATQDSYGQISVQAIIDAASNPAGASALVATQQAGIATQKAGDATMQAALAAATLGAVTAAMNSSNAPYASAAATYLPQGVIGINLTSGGSGGSNGTNLRATFTGGTLQQNPVISFDIVGGVVTNPKLVSPGLYIGSGTPTMPTVVFPGAAGSPAMTLTAGVIVNPGQTYWVVSADNTQILLYGNNAGAVATAPFGSTQVALRSGSYIDSIIKVLQRGDVTKSLIFGQNGGAEVGNVDLLGLWSLIFGIKNLPIAAPDGTITSTITAWNNERSGWKFVVYDATSLAALFGIYTNGTVYLNAAIAELIAARGTAVDLGTRISRGLTPAGSPKTATQNLGRLRGLRSGLTYLKNGGSALVHIILDGDSWWDSKTYGSADAITRFFADSGLTNAGPGWIGFASAVSGGNPRGAAQNNVTVTRAGTWTDLFRSADVTPGTIQNFPGYDAVQCGADGSIYTITTSQLASAVYLRMFCSKGSGVEYSWDNGATYTALTITSGSGSTYVDISLTGKASPLKLRFANGSIVAGLFCLTSTTGVVFSNFGNSGSTAAQKATVQSNADYKAMMAALPGDVTVPFIQLGLNDTKAGMANATIVTNVAAVAAGYRAIFGGYESNDIAILCQPNTPLSVQDALSPLLRSWAEDNDAAFLDWQPYFGLPAYSGDYPYNGDYTSGSLGGKLPLLQVSTGYRHPSPPADLIAASKSPALSGAMVVAPTLSNLFLSPFRSL